MSDRGYAILVTGAKFLFINVLATVIWVIFAQAGWINTEDTIALFYLIINCTTLLSGKMQRILDKLNELEKKQENTENNA